MNKKMDVPKPKTKAQQFEAKWLIWKMHQQSAEDHNVFVWQLGCVAGGCKRSAREPSSGTKIAVRLSTRFSHFWCSVSASLKAGWHLHNVYFNEFQMST